MRQACNLKQLHKALHFPAYIQGLRASATPAAHLHSRVGLVHELKQLVHHCLEELPVLAQELGVLAHHIPAGQGVQQTTRIWSAHKLWGRLPLSGD